MNSFEKDLTIIAVSDEFAVACRECGATGPTVPDLAAVADSWNFMAAMRSAISSVGKK